MARYEELSDSDLIEILREIDEDEDTRMNDWEIEFCDSILGQSTLTPRQKECTIKLIREHGE